MGPALSLPQPCRRYLKNAGGDAEEDFAGFDRWLKIVGFDINPFAVLMAQMNYAALILSLYAEAIELDSDYRILRLPVFRTDSLRMEEREEEGEGPGEEGAAISVRGEKTVEVTIYLPIEGEKKPFHQVSVSVPRYQYARDQNLVINLERIRC